ncbi:hypothetical protein QQM39_02975 [Streptomyces sp. DT2A-34]|uniref:hypothetical protein n=1 Tax=Streptomyces sp. DT2A-34 TaxID=3051182 RepID=UPI00265BF23B|nr:hypothetical protein [Streptomyces sp. DT2A-34]MDO0909860.1 hypothetical protein [Streptomyces sp. DT2A-34]
MTYVSSDGCAVFFTALLAARPQGTRVIATQVRPQPLGTLNQMGPARVLDMYEGDGPVVSGSGGQ